ncbi:MAG: ACT domain-containing protein, partial [Candidatus Limnocylindrales bacterium]
RPGTIGLVGQILGEADVNISAMHLARTTPREDAFMILALDEPIAPEAAQRLCELDAVLALWVVHLS